MKLLIFLILLYLGYRALKHRIAFRSQEHKPYGSVAEIDDVMIKDPYCEVYFPKKSGIPLKTKNKTLYFCSRECKEQYVERMR